jgi:hypothetical protein
MEDLDLKVNAKSLGSGFVSRLSSGLSWIWGSISKTRTTRRSYSETARRNISKEFNAVKHERKKVRIREFVGPLPPIEMSKFSVLQIDSLKKSLSSSPRANRSTLYLQKQSLETIKEESVGKKRVLKSDMENVPSRRVNRQLDEELIDISKNNDNTQLRRNIEHAKLHLEEEKKNESVLKCRFKLSKIEKAVEPLLQACFEKKIDKQLNDANKEITKEQMRTPTKVKPILIDKEVQTGPNSTPPKPEIITEEFNIVPIKKSTPKSEKKRSKSKSSRKKSNTQSLSIIPEIHYYMEDSCTPFVDNELQYIDTDLNPTLISPVNLMSKGSKRSISPLEFTLGRRSDDEFSFGSPRKKF